MATEVEERSSAWHAVWRHAASPLKSERSIRFPRHRNTYHTHVVKIKYMFRGRFTRFVTFSYYFFKVNSSLQLMNATFVAIFLILLAGDISRNPGPVPTITVFMKELRLKIFQF